MPVAEITNATNVTGYVTVFRYANGITGGLFSWLVVAIVTVVTFVLMKDYDTPRALAAASFLGFTLSFFFFGIGLMHWSAFVIFFILICLAIWFAGAQNRG